ncbi:FimD/PapC C-terminal domain-containing protein [Klebsiella quasipneumoniae]|uniref:FimD/PapC C-terminal domain-containing protein n=1 Tax=Klebsiella quasipneumoniae TaxID=1463165 RepID=UPI002ABCDCAD|nr:FimD/PapC C-terminal domain-containing protein [Klebsiella quasipneumoniae]MDZ0184110.1 hypothetical protein [Klebsiella quasipneumoniae]
MPFGATVTYLSNKHDKNITGIVSDNGQVYMSGLEESGILMVQWGRSADAQCKAPYHLNNDNAINGITQADAVCN